MGRTPDVPASEGLDRQSEDIADATLGLYDPRRARIGLQLAPPPQDLHIDAAVEDILMDASRLQQMLARKGPLRRIEKGDQQGIFALGQRHRLVLGIRQAPVAPVELPGAEPAAAPLSLPPLVLLGLRPAALAPAEHRPGARQKLPQAERLGDIVVGPELQPDHTVDLIAPM